jgi:3-hydroxybutyrate dehydrogenase
MRLAGKVALITGGGRGIGREIALRYSEEGAAVALMARSQPGLGAVVEEIAQAAGRALALPADVTSEASVARAVAQAVEALGPIDILVNSAGIYRVARFQDFSLADWKQVFDINVHGSFIVTKAVLPGMLERRRGRIINIASTAGKWGSPYQSAYNASKHAVLGMTKCLALETARFGVRVNAICPAFVDSPMIDEQFPALAQILETDLDTVRRDLQAAVPIGRFVRLDEIPPLAIYLASDESEGMTGQAITLDGGRLFI